MVVSGYFTDPNGDVLSYPPPTVDTEGIVRIALAPNEAGDQVLTITPLASGTATITVTATDPGGLSASVKINVTVHPEGMAPPTYDESLDDEIALKPGEQHIIPGADIENAFDESEDESLRFEASGSDDAIVLVTKADDNTVTITALSKVGDARVTITATDEDDLTAKHEIDVAVRVTLKPEAKGTLSAVTLAVGGEPDVIEDVSEYFVDPDVGELTYTATSSDETKVKATAVGIEVTIEPVAATEEPVTVTITARNGEGSAEQTFSVTVVATPPIPNGEIGDQKLMIGESKQITLDTYFTPGARSYYDDLDYSASSDTDKVEAVIARGSNVLIIRGVASGTAIVTVTATDNHNETSDPQKFMVTVTEEEIDAVPLPSITGYLQNDAYPSRGGPQTISLSKYFDGAESYSAGSNDTKILMVSVAGHTLTLAPVPGMHGTARVTVTPINSDSVAGPQQTFDVIVQAEPTLKKEFMSEGVVAFVADDTEATEHTNLNNAVLRLMLDTYITDPDGDDMELKFSTKTNNAKIVAVYDTPTAIATSADTQTERDMPATSLDKATDSKKASVTLRGRTVGAETITVMATDEDGHENEWTFTVTVVSGNSPPTAVAVGDIPAGTIKDLDGDPAATRMDVGDIEKVIDDKLITALFDNGSNGDDFLRGDVLTFDLKVYPNGTLANGIVGASTNTDGTANRLLEKDHASYRAPHEEGKAQVEGNLSTDRWTGSRTSRITVTLTALRGNTADPVLTTATAATDVVAIIATDKFGLSAVQLINVRVNHTMKAEGAQDKPRSLSGTGENGVVATGGSFENKNGVLEVTWDTSTDNARVIELVDDDEGYFHDPDGDSITCSYVRSPAEPPVTDPVTPTPVATVVLNSTNNQLTITPTQSTGTLTVTVTCKETLAGDGSDIEARFGPSVTDTLKVRVTGKTFSQR